MPGKMPGILHASLPPLTCPHLPACLVLPTPCLARCSCADALLRNLYRWVCSPASRLYDPALKQVGG